MQPYCVYKDGLVEKGFPRAYDSFVQKMCSWPWKPIIWKSCILPKHRFAIWLFAHDKFLTRDRLGDMPDKRCVLCNGANESFGHIFF